MPIFALIFAFLASSLLSTNYTSGISNNIIKTRLDDFLQSFSNEFNDIKSKCAPKLRKLQLNEGDIDQYLSDIITNDHNINLLNKLLDDISEEVYLIEYQKILEDFIQIHEKRSAKAAIIFALMSVPEVLTWMFYGALNWSEEPENHNWLIFNIAYSGLWTIFGLFALSEFVYASCCFKDLKHAIADPDFENNNPNLCKYEVEKNVLNALRFFKNQVRKGILGQKFADPYDCPFAPQIVNESLIKFDEGYKKLIDLKKIVEEAMKE